MQNAGVWEEEKVWKVGSRRYVQFFVTPWTAARQASLSITFSWSLLKLRSIESLMPSNHLILCHPLLLLQSFPASGSFPMSQLFTSGSQSIGASASASVLQHTAFFLVQLSHPYMTTRKTIALTKWTSVSKVTSLLFNTLARFGRNIDLPLTCLRSMGKPYCFLALTSMPATAYLPPG